MLQTLIDRSEAAPWPLGPELIERYGGPLGFPERAGRPTIIANFVSTLDGVISYAIPGQAGGGPISGNDKPDRFVMGLLRACADAVVVGAGTLRDVRPEHAWTGGYIFPPATEAYAALRRAMRKPPQPLTVVVTTSGAIDLRMTAFHAPDVLSLVVTTAAGAERLAGEAAATGVPVRTAPPANSADPGGSISIQAVLSAIAEQVEARLVLTEGGPVTLSSFVEAGLLDELFLTLAPQIAGRSDVSARPALVHGVAFTPQTAPWARLISAKGAGEHLYLRYGFNA